MARATAVSDGTTMANKTWNSLAGSGDAAFDQFDLAPQRLRMDMSQTVSPGKGKVGNRIGEYTGSLKSQFTPAEPKKTTGESRVMTHPSCTVCILQGGVATHTHWMDNSVH